jgi:hypothetical protein
MQSAEPNEPIVQQHLPSTHCSYMRCGRSFVDANAKCGKDCTNWERDFDICGEREQCFRNLKEECCYTAEPTASPTTAGSAESAAAETPEPTPGESTIEATTPGPRTPTDDTPEPTWESAIEETLQPTEKETQEPTSIQEARESQNETIESEPVGSPNLRSNIPSSMPSHSPSSAPYYEGYQQFRFPTSPSTFAPTPVRIVDVTVYNMTLALVYIGPLSQSEIDELMILMKDWFLEFYRTGGEAKTGGELGQLQRFLGRRRDARNIYTEMKFISQEVIYTENGAPLNEIVYNQRLVYEDPVGGDVDFGGESSTGEGTNDEEVDNSINIDGLVPGEIATMPFEDLDANLGLSTTLTENIESLKGVQIPLSVPVVPVQEHPQMLVVDHGKDEDRMSLSPTAVSAMIVVLGLMVSVGGFYWYDIRLAAAKMH